MLKYSCSAISLIAAMLAATQAHAIEFKSRENLPDHQLITWHDSSGETEGSPDFNTYPSKSLRCGNTLYPTHPQQSLKLYSISQWGEFDMNRVDAEDSHVCLVKTNRSSGKQSCLRTDTAITVVLSDVFMDRCGELYRAFKEISFVKQDETMGTLFSPGRTTYRDPKSEFSQSYISGGTYAVPANIFAKIGPPLRSDIEKIEELRSEAMATHYYDPQSHLFIQK